MGVAVDYLQARLVHRGHRRHLRRTFRLQTLSMQLSVIRLFFFDSANRLTRAVPPDEVGRDGPYFSVSGRQWALRFFQHVQLTKNHLFRRLFWTGTRYSRSWFSTQIPKASAPPSTPAPSRFRPSSNIPAFSSRAYGKTSKLLVPSGLTEYAFLKKKNPLILQ